MCKPGNVAVKSKKLFRKKKQKKNAAKRLTKAQKYAEYLQNRKK